MKYKNIESLYEQHGSVLATARVLGVGYSTLRYHMTKQGIPIKRTGYKAPRTKQVDSGAKHHNWRGGTYSANGYIFEYAPSHPEAKSRKGYVLQHRLIMERHMGRKLNQNELVHHKNGDTKDNRIGNLEVMSRPGHVRHHKKEAKRDEKGRFTI